MKKATLLSLAIMMVPTLSYADDIKVYKYSSNGTPTTFDTTQAGTVYTSTITTAIYDTLYEYKYLKKPFELKTNLATSMPEVSKDGLTYTIKIKKGVTYSDDPAFADGKGREVVASDFVYSLKRHFDPENRSQGAWLWAGKIVGLDDWKKKALITAKRLKV